MGVGAIRLGILENHRSSLTHRRTGILWGGSLRGGTELPVHRRRIA